MIERLKVTYLRNLNRVDLSPSVCNVFLGKNGSGKTSLLESLFLLSRGKSFRTHQPKRYIQHHCPSCVVFTKFKDSTTLAIQKHTDASTLLKLDGNTIKTQSELTRQMPTLLIDPSSMEILEHGSGSRRQLLDWLTFHMKHGFYQQWLAYQKLLKQRNSLLKQIKSLTPLYQQQIEAWDIGLTTHAELIHHYRQSVFDQWVPLFKQTLEYLLPQYAKNIDMSYQAGFDTTVLLSETLSDKLLQDVQQGYTRTGCHRADIQVYWRSSSDVDKKIKEQAANVLSRGEKKLLITALKLSQLLLLQQQSLYQIDGSPTNLNKKSSETSKVLLGNSELAFIGDVSCETQPINASSLMPIVLLDDITAELDESALEVLLTTLASIPCQVFITSLSDEILPFIEKNWQEYKLFHVEHGQVDEYQC